MSVLSHWQKRPALLVVLLAASFVGGCFAFASHSSEDATVGTLGADVSTVDDDMAGLSAQNSSESVSQNNPLLNDTPTSLYLSRDPKLYDLKSDDKDFCDAIWRGIEERRLKETGFCGVPAPQGDADFAFLKWIPLDPKEHVDIVEEMFLWGSVRTSNAYPFRNLSIHEWSSIQSMEQLPQDLRDRFLLPVREELHARLSEIELYYSEFDFDMDGEKEVIYRMTPVYRKLVGPALDNSSGTSKPTARELGPLITDPPSPCRDIGLPGQKKAYLHYVESADEKLGSYLRRFGLGGRDTYSYLELFLWQGRLAVAGDRGTAYSITKKELSGHIQQVCSILKRSNRN
ncbi:MAG: hypothetical protein EP347_00225 [Alphaproteobacteria bacterium]|nr:MAG: hypothetical protein EP347_00225 [Alphaproteobacteria bacterium]